MPSPAGRTTITPEEKLSVVWLKVERILTARLQELRIKNDGKLGPEDTARLRGEISMCKEILEWATPTPEIN